MSDKPISIYLSYAAEDKALAGELRALLEPSAKRGGFTIRSEASVPPGGAPKREIPQMIAGADLILCLLSAAYFNDERTSELELAEIERRGKAAGAKVVVTPIYLRPMAALDLAWPWADELKGLPSTKKEVTRSTPREEVWQEIATEIFATIRKLRGGGDAAAAPKKEVAPSPVAADSAGDSPDDAPATNPAVPEKGGEQESRRTGAWSKKGVSEAPGREAVSGKVSKEQHKRLTEALLDAFSDYDDLRMMLEHGLGVRLARIVSDKGLEKVVFEIIEWANKQDRIPELLVAARQANPWNIKLLAFTEDIGAGPQLDVGAGAVRARGPGFGNLEKINRQRNGFLDPEPFMRELARREGQVCLIEYPNGEALGTGFLVGPDRVLTNAHVVDAFLSEGDAADEVVLRFDHRVLRDGRTVGDGTVHRLSPEKWLLARSPEDKLDYALLQLQGRAGDDELGANKDVAPRGFIKPATRKLTVGTPLLILQHPGGQPLRLAIDTEGVVGLSPDGNLVWYATNTLPGSSGSPCFDPKFQLVALHHGAATSTTGDQNEGIPILQILADLKAKGIPL